MAIAEQFAGLNMDQLIGAPLRAAADASSMLADSTASFINTVGFDGNGKVRTVAFGYQKRSVNEDGTSNLDEMKVDVPMLAIVPIPNLQVDEVNILFDMEVKQSERQESALDMGASLSGTAKLGIIKVSVTGSVSAHQSNTRSSDNSAKYHVDVRATNHGIPEGLARVLDMMAENVAPTLVGSTIKDGDGKSLPDKARIKAERLKALRHEIGQIENRLGVANDSLGDGIMQLKRLASAQLNVYREKMNGLQSQSTDDTKASVYAKTMDDINQRWNEFQNLVGDIVKTIADSSQATDGGTDTVSDLFNLKALSDNGEQTEAYSSSQTYYKTIASVQNSTVSCQRNVSDLEKQLFEKKSEYSGVMADAGQ